MQVQNELTSPVSNTRLQTAYQGTPQASSSRTGCTSPMMCVKYPLTTSPSLYILRKILGHFLAGIQHDISGTLTESVDILVIASASDTPPAIT